MAINSPAGWGLFVLRVVVGIIFLVHGYTTFENGLAAGARETAKGFEGLQIPQPLLAAWAAKLLEVVGGLGLILGLLTPLWNVLFIVHQLAGIYFVHGPRGFFVIGPGQGGYEFSLLLIAANLCLLVAGPGLLALTGHRRGLRGRR